MCPAGSPIQGSPSTALLEANLAGVRQRIAEACSLAGRNPDEVHLVAVTKRVDGEVAAALTRLGQVDLGESRVQELVRKAEGPASSGADVRWHLIGHLQRNKVRRAVRIAHAIHSADSIRLLEALDHAAGEEERRPRVYLEVQLTEVAGRTGLPPEELRPAVVRLTELEHLVPAGLMTMAPRPQTDGEPVADAGERLARQEGARHVFRCLRELRDDLAADFSERFAGGRIELSMGMSADLEAAVVEGADWVRVGTALYEPRDDTGAQPS